MSFILLLAAVALPLKGQRGARGIALALVSFVAVAVSLFDGQAEPIFVLLFSLALMALVRGRPFLGGTLFGLMALKPQYAMVFGLVFLYKRRWRELSGMVMAGMALLLVSMAMVGPEGMLQYAESLRRIGGFYAPPDEWIYPEIMVNWRAVLINLWPGISESAGLAVTGLLGVITLVASLLVWRGAWDASSPRFASQMLAVTLAMVVALPHSHFHGTVMLLPPLALALARPDRGFLAKPQWKLMLTIGYVLPFFALAPRTHLWTLAPYYLLSMVMLVFQPRDRSGLAAQHEGGSSGLHPAN